MEYLVALVVTTLGLCLLVVLVLFLWREYRVDVFRQRIFLIRDELFDLAAEGRISFDAPAYGSLRTILNGYIRFAHKMSMTRTLGMFLLRRLVPNPALERSASDLLGPIEQHPDAEVREKLRKIFSRANFEIFRFVAWPSVILLMPSILALLAGTSIYRRVTRRGDEIAETVRVEAIEFEIEELESSGIRRFQPV
jgi:hypothetical protein